MPTVENNFQHGALPVLVGSGLWGISYFLAKISLDGITPFALCFYVALLSCLQLFLFKRYSYNALYNKLKTNIVILLALAFTWVSGTVCFFYGLLYLDLGIATVIEKLQPVFAIFLAWLFLSETVSMKTILLSALALVASYFVSIADPLTAQFRFHEIIGILCMTSAALSYAIASVMTKVIVQKDIQPLDIVVLRFGLAIPMLLLVILFRGETGTLYVDIGLDWLSLLALSLTAWLGYHFYYMGFRHITVTVGSLLELVTPVVSLALGLIFLSETLSLTQWIAIPVMLWAVYKITTLPSA